MKLSTMDKTFSTESDIEAMRPRHDNKTVGKYIIIETEEHEIKLTYKEVKEMLVIMEELDTLSRKW